MDCGTPTDALAGLVKEVTFHSVETGFCVLQSRSVGSGIPCPWALAAARLCP
jgi:hypothetical protein